MDEVEGHLQSCPRRRSERVIVGSEPSGSISPPHTRGPWVRRRYTAPGGVTVCAALLILLSRNGIVRSAAGQDFGLNRRYDQYAYVTTHNSFANDVEDYNPLVANQYPSIMQQLDAGVRGLMFDTYLARQRSQAGVRSAELYGNSNDSCSSDFCASDLEVVLAHNPAGTQYTLLDGFPVPHVYPPFRALRRDLGIVREWMDEHPREIVTIVMESDFVDPPMMMGEFEAVGLANMIFWADRPNPGFVAPDGTLWEVERHGWPRVGWMADANRRLVVFSDRGEDGDGLPHQWDYMAENEFGDESSDPATAAGNRAGSVGLSHKAYSLLFVNYFPTLNVQGDIPFDELNATSTITACLAAIRDVTSRPPNFLAVDHFHKGIQLPGLPPGGSGPGQVVNSLNGQSWPGVPFIQGTHAITPPPNAAGWHRTAVTAAIDGVNDLGDIVWVEYDIRGWVDESSNFNGPTAFDLTADGDYLVNYQVVGSLENRSDARFFRIRIDLRDPGTQARLTPAEAAVRSVVGPVQVELVAQDGRSGVESTWFRIGDGAAVRYSDVVEVTGDGPVRLSYWSVDVAGNEEPAQELTLVFDPPPPTSTPTSTPTQTPTSTPTSTRTPLAAGDRCSSADECASTFCINGVCCATDCSGRRDRCDQPGDVGNCVPLPLAPAPALSWHGLLMAVLLLLGVATLGLRPRRSSRPCRRA